MRRIDLNCDMGESFGAYQIGNDCAILPYITSANIACGFHAGDPLVMQETIRQAHDHGVSVGAHPGLPDLQGFGRREMNVSLEEVYAYTQYQIGALQGMAAAQHVPIRHVKAHGALYNMAARDEQLSRAFIQAVHALDPQLKIVGLAGSAWVQAATKENKPLVQEVFADRNYEEDGSLTPRSQPDALITDIEQAVDHVLRMALEGVVRTRQGTLRPVQADTICIHGDGPRAVEFAHAIYSHLTEEGILVQHV